MNLINLPILQLITKEEVSKCSRVRLELSGSILLVTYHNLGAKGRGFCAHGHNYVNIRFNEYNYNVRTNVRPFFYPLEFTIINPFLAG
jgi:hypothetical protein